MRRLLTLSLLLTTYVGLWAQVSRLADDVQYDIALQGTVGNGDTAPFWFTNNRYGLGTLETKSGLLRASLHRDAESDSLRKWRIGYGVDLVGALNHDSHVVLQQAYADFQYKAIRLSIGQKERPLELKNQQLSTGAMTTGINARPLPQVRLELPDFWAIPRTKNWLALKAHIAYGMYTDNRWQRHFASGTNSLYTANSLYHSKAGFLRIGNVEKFPLTLTGGLEMSCQFGGEAWNLADRGDHTDPNFQSHQKLPHGIKAFWHAFIPGGSDVNDGDYANAEGNQLGSWHLRLDYHGHDWGVALYAEHFFEDHSQLFLQYPWKDMLYGGEIRLPKNPVASSFVYEHIRTKDQSGPIYHDATATFPEDIFGTDNYYNHHIYGGWQHAGFALGNPLLTSPVYNNDGKITFYDNRIKAHHFGINGQPTPEVAYRILYTHEKSWGNYIYPHTSPKKGDYLLLEATYSPRQVKGLSVTASYGQNWGKLLGGSKGGMLTVAYTGWIKKK
ncbi:MAG: hypothetical protein IJV08_00075 [Bacteroidaceae bacterium]|nr:hypothetical protein [Bacteroidaceae bacterium]